jgi:hypothetical protein
VDSCRNSGIAKPLWRSHFFCFEDCVRFPSVCVCACMRLHTWVRLPNVVVMYDFSCLFITVYSPASSEWQCHIRCFNLRPSRCLLLVGLQLGIVI